MRQVVAVLLVAVLSFCAWTAGVFGASLWGYWAGRQTAGIPLIEGEIGASKLEWLRLSSGLQRWEFSIADQFAASMIGLTDREVPPAFVTSPSRLLLLGVVGATPIAVAALWCLLRPATALQMRLLRRGVLRIAALSLIGAVGSAIAAGLAYYGWMSLRDTFVPREVIATPTFLESAAMGAAAGLSLIVWLPGVVRAIVRASVLDAERLSLPWCTNCDHGTGGRTVTGAMLCPECGAAYSSGVSAKGSPFDPPLRTRVLSSAALVLFVAVALTFAADLGCIRARLRGDWEIGKTGDYIMYWPTTGQDKNTATTLTLRFDDGTAVLRMKNATTTDADGSTAAVEKGVVELETEWTSNGRVIRNLQTAESESGPGILKGGATTVGPHRIVLVPHSWRLTDGRSLVEVAVTGRLITADIR